MTALRDPIWEPATFEPDPATAFGPIISAVEVESAIAQTVRIWWRDYLAEAERQRGQRVGSWPTFRAIVLGGRSERLPEDQLPALLVTSPGLDGGAIEFRQDCYTCRWRVELVAEIAARGNREAPRIARIYAAQLRALVLQKALSAPSRPPAWLRKVDWLPGGEDYILRDWTVERTRAAGRVRFVVEVADVLDRTMGPRVPMFSPTDEPDEPPPMLLREVESSHVEVTKFEEEKPHA